jgi:hypothetical protein
MKTQLLFLGALFSAALACESRDFLTESEQAGIRQGLLATTQSNKSSPAKQPSPAASSAPAPKPGKKDRGARPVRPAYLFL